MANNLNILLVEDDIADAALCEHMLEDYMDIPFHINHVNCLGAAVGEINEDNENRYDIILLDLNLGDSKGISTLKVFRNYCKDLPILVFSGMIDTQTVGDAIIHGADKYLVKGSFRPSMLANEVRNILLDYNNKFAYV